MNVNFPGGSKAAITWGSVIWLGIVTAIGTVVGEYAYETWVSPYFNCKTPAGPLSGVRQSSVFSDSLGGTRRPR